MSSPTVQPAPVSTASALKRHRSGYRWTFTDFRALDRALVSDDLNAAREAFSRLQEDSSPIAEALSRHPFPEDTTHLRALKELGRTLFSGDLRGAKRAFQQFQ